MSPWVGIGAFAVALPLSMAVLSAFARRGRVSPEAARKLLHVEMALVTAAFPWIFSAAWPVIALSVGSAAWFGLVQRLRPAGRRFGVVLETQRRSGGQFWFACAVGLAFLTAGDAATYCMAILVMGLADSAAALAGTRWGRARWVARARKSAAGSAAFGMTAFAVAAIVPIAAGNAPIAAILAAAALIALATTLVELLLADGLDNLFVPLAAIVASRWAAGAGAAVLAASCLVLALALFASLRGSRPCAA